MELTPWLIAYAYSHGAFPMTLEDGAIEWFRPDRRALFALTGMHVSRSLHRVLRKGLFKVTYDQAFESVMRGCKRPKESWISEPLIQVYTQIYHQGWGHSAECWLEDNLVGGVYGIALGRCFFAESMFSSAPNASKVALWALIEKCRELGFSLFDAQIMNPHLASLGAFEVTDHEYQKMLQEALAHPTTWSKACPIYRIDT